MAFYDTDLLLKYIDTLDITERTFDTDEVIFRLGSPVTKVYFVVTGEVRAEKYLENGNALVFFRARDGQALSEENLYLDNHIYSGVAAVPGTVVRSVSKDKLLEALLRNPRAFQGFISCLVNRYSNSLMHRELLSIRSAEERLLTWLRWLSSDNKNNKTIHLEGRMGTLGADLGLTRESVYRAFKSLEKSGHIKRDEGVITLTCD